MLPRAVSALASGQPATGGFVDPAAGQPNVEGSLGQRLRVEGLRVEGLRAEGLRAGDGPAPPMIAEEQLVDDPGGEARDGELRALAAIAGLSSLDLDPIQIAVRATAILGRSDIHRPVAIYVRSAEGLTRCAAVGPAQGWPDRVLEPRAGAAGAGNERLPFEAVAGGSGASPVGCAGEVGTSTFGSAAAPRPPLAAISIPTGNREWGLLCARADAHRALEGRDLEVLAAAAAQIGATIHSAMKREDLARQLRRSEALRSVIANASGKLDLDHVLAVFVDNALALCGADRAAALLRRPDGRLRAGASRGLSEAYLDAVRAPGRDGLIASALECGATACAAGYVEDARSLAIREIVAAEGFDTICCSPLIDEGRPLGILAIYHDERHTWTPDELSTLDELAAEASVAIRTTQNFAQMAAWAAQLQSIQQLGSRLARLTTVGEIAAAIALELRQVIDYQNVRVYRVADGDRLLAVARDGYGSEYDDETPQSLELKIGQGITGWVALHGNAEYLPDAAADPRTQVIPGTNDTAEESMLLAPMLFEGRVLGVLVLSKLGLHQFGEDDLRLLVIYAMFAAQAMANADTTERLRAQTVLLGRQLRSQRELIQITESILSTLDSRAIVGQITDRLYPLVAYDRIAVDLGNAEQGELVPVAGRETRLEPAGLSSPASLLEVPLRSLGTVTGRLQLMRYGDEPPFEPHEVELVRLFAGHVSIALQNAEVHQEAETRARTDGLTGLINQSTLGHRLGAAVISGEPFSLIMLDLDDFKRINDQMGHQAGDVTLQTIARAIVGVARDSDVVFRYGGDEFAVLLPGTRPDGAQALADRIRDALHGLRVGPPGRDRRGNRRDVEVSASIGIAAFPDDGRTADEVLLAADRACYVAKRGGRDRIANAQEGRALAEEFTLQVPTPVDSSSAGEPLEH